MKLEFAHFTASLQLFAKSVSNSNKEPAHLLLSPLSKKHGRTDLKLVEKNRDCDRAFVFRKTGKSDQLGHVHTFFSDAPLIDHLVMREFVSGPPSYRFIYERVRDRKPSLRKGS